MTMNPWLGRPQAACPRRPRCGPGGARRWPSGLGAGTGRAERWVRGWLCRKPPRPSPGFLGEGWAPPGSAARWSRCPRPAPQGDRPEAELRRAEPDKGACVGWPSRGRWVRARGSQSPGAEGPRPARSDPVCTWVGRRGGGCPGTSCGRKCSGVTGVAVAVAFFGGAASLALHPGNGLPEGVTATAPHPFLHLQAPPFLLSSLPLCSALAGGLTQGPPLCHSLSGQWAVGSRDAARRWAH